MSTAPINHNDFYDAELHRYNPHFRKAAAVRPTDHVLDVGCGTGQTTREAARSAHRGSAVGVDISAAMLERARRLTDAEGTPNVTYEVGDAQTHRFPASRFDVCISRFGTMFFTDPVAGFANIGRAMRPDARLVLLAWQHAERNEWFTTIRAALADLGASTASWRDLEAFSLAEPSSTQHTLTAAGFDRSSSLTFTNPSSTAPTPPAPTTRSSASGMSASSSTASTRPPRSEPITSCAPPSTHTTPVRASSSTHAPGSSPPATPEIAQRRQRRADRDHQ